LGEETLARPRVALADRPDDLARFEEVVATALRAGPLTEEHNYWIDRVAQAHARRIALAAGERLVRERVLETADDVFLLYAAEIADALRAPRPLDHVVARRRRELATWQRANPPKTLGSPPAAPPTITPGVALERVDFEYAVTQDRTDVLRGVTASPGVAHGPAGPSAEGGD